MPLLGVWLWFWILGLSNLALPHTQMAVGILKNVGYIEKKVVCNGLRVNRVAE